MTVQVLIGDCREVLRTLPDESVHCVVTSPPYWGLRDYGTAKWEGGDPDCAHAGSHMRTAPAGTEKQQSNLGAVAVRSGNCACGAIRIDSQLGLERTPDEYVANMVAVFREVRRVLRKDGTLWLNLGDSYYGGKGQNGNSKARETADVRGYKQSGGTPMMSTRALDMPQEGLKPKDLVGIPWRVAFALQADGWWLRQDIIWSKPNPMPESVRDRCTKSHEYLFLLSKSATYYYDAESIAEESICAGQMRPFNDPGKSARVVNGKTGTGNERPGAPPVEIAATRNKRSVWTVTTQPFSEAHFATFPPALIEPCVLAGCPKDGTVLDPFGGAGTTGLVADRLQRNAILIELNPEYAAMGKRRIQNDAPLFAEVS